MKQTFQYNLYLANCSEQIQYWINVLLVAGKKKRSFNIVMTVLQGDNDVFSSIHVSVCLLRALSHLNNKSEIADG